MEWTSYIKYSKAVIEITCTALFEIKCPTIKHTNRNVVTLLLCAGQRHDGNYAIACLAVIQKCLLPNPNIKHKKTVPAKIDTNAQTTAFLSLLHTQLLFQV